MSNLFTQLRSELLSKHVDSCNPEQLLKGFEYFYEKYGDYVCPQKAGDFGDCLYYLKKLVFKFKPEIGMVQMFGDTNGVEFKRKSIEEAYLYYLVLLAHIEEYYKEPVFAAFFARKALDMVNYFHPCLNDLSKAQFIQENEQYKIAFDIFQKYKTEWEEYKSAYTNGDFETDMLLDWEMEIYNPTSHANQNFQYRIYD